MLVINCCTELQMPNFFDQERKHQAVSGRAAAPPERCDDGAVGSDSDDRRSGDDGDDAAAPAEALAYLRFPISYWRNDRNSRPPKWEHRPMPRHSHDMRSHAGVLGFFEEVN